MREFFCLAGALLVSAVALAWGCGSSVTVVGTTSSAGGASSSSKASVSSTDAGIINDAGPGPMTATGTGGAGAAPSCVPTKGPTLAADKVYLGDRDWNGGASAQAWQLFGRDIDGKSFGAGNMAGHCQLHAGAPVSVAQDGPGGLDNSFGRNVVPLIASLAPNFNSVVATGYVHAGGFTILLELVALGGASDQSPLIANYYPATHKGAKFDGSDCWPPYPSSAVFPEAAIAGNQFNSKSPTTIQVPLQTFGAWPLFFLTIHDAIVSVVLSADHQTGTLGFVSGVLDREEFIAALKHNAEPIAGIQCWSNFDALAEQIRQAADVMVDGTQDPTKECDGISFGIGFTMKADGLGPTFPPGPPPTPCK